MPYRFLDFAGITAAFLLVCARSMAAENLVVNSGFEMGSTGYVCIKYLRPEHNPQMKYEGAQLDTAAPSSGRQALKIPNRFAEHFRIFGREVKLQPGTEYTFSFACRSTMPGAEIKTVWLSVSQADGWHAGSGSIKPTPQWQRYSCSFKVPAGRNPAYYTLLISTDMEKSAELRPGDVWFDDLMLVEGKETSYRPFPGVEVCVAAPPLLLRGQDRNATAETILLNNTDKQQKVKIRLDMTADHGGNFQDPVYGEKRPLPEGEIALGPGEKRVIKMPLPLDRLGSFELVPVVAGAERPRVASGFTAVAGKYERKPIDFDQTFCVAFNHGGGGGFIMPPAFGENGQPGYRTAVGMDEYLRMMGDMGCRLFRDLDYPAPVIRWSAIEKEPGKMDFRLADLTVDKAAQYGITILPILGEFEKRYIPAWCYEQRTETSEYPGRMNSLKGKIFMPPMTLWRNYVRNVARHYQGRLRYFEIANEPNLYLAPQDYLTCLKAAYEEIKAVDPNNRVVGFCSTGDLGGSLTEYLESCFKLGGLQYADIVSFHPYASPHMNAIVPADRLDAELKVLPGKYGHPGMPLWNTEIYYLTGRGKGSADKGFYRPSDAAQRFLTDLGEGIGQSISVPGETVFRNPWATHNHAPIAVAMVYPNANYVTYNALARLFEGAKPLEKIRWGNDSVCYVFRKNDKFIAGFWNYSGAQGLKLTLPLNDEQAELLDVYGNKINLNPHPLPLSVTPYYLADKSGDLPAFLKALRAAIVEADKPVTAGENVRLLPRGSGWEAVVALRNCTGAVLAGEVGIQGDGMVGGKIVRFEIPAGKSAVVAIPVTLRAGGAPTDAIVKTYVNKRLWEFPVKVLPRSEIYHVSSTPGKSVALLRSTGKKAAQHSAEFSAAVEGEHLRLSVTVKDTSDSGPVAGRYPWEQDCVELFFDANPELLSEKYATVYHDYVGRILIVPAADGAKLTFMPKKLQKFTAENIQCTSARNADGYIVSLNIPFDALTVPGSPQSRLIGFDIAVDNAGAGEKAVQQLHWNSTGDAYKNRCSFGILTFDK